MKICWVKIELSDAEAGFVFGLWVGAAIAIVGVFLVML